MPRVYYNAQIQHEGNGNKSTDMMKQTNAKAGEETGARTEHQHKEGPYQPMVPRESAPTDEETPKYAKLNGLI